MPPTAKERYEPSATETERYLLAVREKTCFGCGSTRSRLLRWLPFDECPMCRAPYCGDCWESIGVRVKGKTLRVITEEKWITRTCRYCHEAWTEQIRHYSGGVGSSSLAGMLAWLQRPLPMPPGSRLAPPRLPAATAVTTRPNPLFMAVPGVQWPFGTVPQGLGLVLAPG